MRKSNFIFFNAFPLLWAAPVRILNPLTCLGDALDILRTLVTMRPSPRRHRGVPRRMRNSMTLWSPRFLAGLLAFSFFLTACGEDEASARRGRRGGPIPVVAEPATLEAERLRLRSRRHLPGPTLRGALRRDHGGRR